MDLDGRVPALRRAFGELTGGEPEQLCAAPGRVNVIGEHTDYNDGLVLPIAIDRQALVAVRHRGDGAMRCWSLQEAGPGWQRYPLGVARALIDAGLRIGGFDLVVDSDVPIGAGLSSSAALECAAALALTGAGADADADADRTELARICQRAENVYVGAPTGIMDQMASLLGRAGHALLLDCRSRSLRAEAVPLPLDGLSLLVVDTKVAHDLAGGGYAQRRRECQRAARALGVGSLRDASPGRVETLDEPLRRRARHVVTENARVQAAADLLRGGRMRDLGPLLDASHASLRDDFEVSIDELDVVVDVARAGGALGARMTGGGFGGSAIALVPTDRAMAVREAVEQAFARRGWGRPDLFEVSPAAGASRSPHQTITPGGV